MIHSDQPIRERLKEDKQAKQQKQIICRSFLPVSDGQQQASRSCCLQLRLVGWSSCQQQALLGTMYHSYGFTPLLFFSLFGLRQTQAIQTSSEKRLDPNARSSLLDSYSACVAQHRLHHARRPSGDQGGSSECEESTLHFLANSSVVPSKNTRQNCSKNPGIFYQAE